MPSKTGVTLVEGAYENKSVGKEENAEGVRRKAWRRLKGRDIGCKVGSNQSLIIE